MEIEKGIRVVEDKNTIHVNLISQTEMKAHTKEMRNETDRKFVECLMAQGLTRLEANKKVNTWSVRWNSESHGN